MATQAPPGEARSFIADTGRLGKDGAGRRLERALLGIGGDLPAFWEPIVCAMRDQPRRDLTVEVEREYAIAAASAEPGECEANRMGGDSSKGNDSHDPLGRDDSAFVPAKTLWQDHFQGYKQFRVWLDNTPDSSVRRRKPSKNRLLIHAADWAKYWAAKSKETFDNLDEAKPAEIVETFTEGARQRTADLRAKKQGRPQGKPPLDELAKRIKAGK